MNTEENKRSIIVGVFVLLAIAILVAGVFILGGQQKRFESTILVSAIFDNVEGLKNGNNVWFSGVKIGTVKGIKLHGNSQVEVTMKIEEDAQKYIRMNANARLSSESLIGNKIIEIYGGSPQAPPIQDGGRLHSVNALSTDDIMETLQENNKNLVSITDDFKQLTAKIAEGQGTAGALLTDSTLADNFRSIIANLERTSSTTVQASRALSQFTTKLNTKGGLANELLTDTTVFNKLQASAAKLEQTTSSAAVMTDNFKEASSKLNDKNNALGLLVNDPEFAQQLKSTLQNLESSSEKLDENMEALKHNFLFRGYFRKQAKKEAKEVKEAGNSDDQ